MYRNMGLNDFADAMQTRLLPSLSMVLTEATNSPTRSRLGGLPDLPLGDAWPVSDGVTLAFIGQLDLSELPSATLKQSLPRHGILLFFYDAENQPWGFDPKDRGRWAVRYVEDKNRGVVIESFPKNLPDSARFPAMPINFEASVSLPTLQGTLLQTVLPEREDFLVWDIYHEYLERTEGEVRHKLSGNPDPVQEDHMAIECQLVSNGVFCGGVGWHNDPTFKGLQAGFSEWQLLLQVDSDDRTQMMWGDSGRLYYWIRESDLKTGNFDDVWVVLQCG